MNRGEGRSFPSPTDFLPQGGTCKFWTTLNWPTAICLYSIVHFKSSCLKSVIYTSITDAPEETSRHLDYRVGYACAHEDTQVYDA